MDEAEIAASLRELEADPAYITEPSFSANAEEWPTGKIPFFEYHIQYLKRHPLVKPEYYLSNLRLTSRRR